LISSEEYPDDINRGKYPIGHFMHHITISGNGKYCAIFSPHSDYIAMLNLTDGNLINIFDEHSDTVSCISFSIDGNELISGSTDGTVKLWDTKRGCLIGSTEVHQDAISAIKYSPDGKYFIFALGRKNSYLRDSDSEIQSRSNKKYPYTIEIYENLTGHHLRTINAHVMDINSLSYNPDCLEFLSASYDGTIKIWKSESGELAETIYPLLRTNIINANLTNIVSDSLTENEILILKQNGAVTDSN
jgi:WD40 repeat protein